MEVASVSWSAALARIGVSRQHRDVVVTNSYPLTTHSTPFEETLEPP